VHNRRFVRSTMRPESICTGARERLVSLDSTVFAKMRSFRAQAKGKFVGFASGFQAARQCDQGWIPLESCRQGGRRDSFFSMGRENNLPRHLKCRYERSLILRGVRENQGT
jgi:hypothetical protein